MINADAKLKEIFGKAQVSMFEMADRLHPASTFDAGQAGPASSAKAQFVTGPFLVFPFDAQRPSDPAPPSVAPIFIDASVIELRVPRW